jgi:sugar transferase (PEP-CTERM/EpsH1 system associated)
VETRPLIAHVVYRFAVGGLENGVVNLINHMPHTKWRHVVVSLTDIDPGFAARIQRTDVQCFALHKPPGQGIWQYPKLFKLYRRLQPAVVHTRNLAALEAQVPAWGARVPVRLHGEHGRDVEDLHGQSVRHQWMRRTYKPFVQHYIALSRDLSAYLQDRVGVPGHRLTQIYNGVDQQRFNPAPQGRSQIEGSPFNDPRYWLAGTVGRMQTVKAQPHLAQAFVQVLQQHPVLRDRLRLVMVGEGPLRAECEAILRDQGLSACAWFSGERSDVPDVMRGLNCFVLPSVAEGISNTILEAMSSGLPVLATNVGGNADLVAEGRTGHLVPAADVHALAHSLAALALDPLQAASMGHEGRRKLEAQFSLGAMVAAYEGVYQSLLKRFANRE